MDTRLSKHASHENPVGDLLRGWRNHRAISQADLAFEAGISIKHLSFVETGKAVGSRDILLQLAATWRELLKLPDLPAAQFDERETSGPLCEVRLRKGDVAVSLIGTVLTLGTPQDITLQELRVEMFMPADAASEAVLADMRST